MTQTAKSPQKYGYRIYNSSFIRIIQETGNLRQCFARASHQVKYHDPFQIDFPPQVIEASPKSYSDRATFEYVSTYVQHRFFVASKHTEHRGHIFVRISVYFCALCHLSSLRPLLQLAHLFNIQHIQHPFY